MLGVEALKIASSDATNLPFLRNVSGLNIPVILSTGMCTFEEVRDAVQSLNDVMVRGELSILQCTSEYPAPLSEANLRVMRTFERVFGCPVGFSDHTEGTDAAAWAVANGAKIIEKHFTLDRRLPGPDHRASVEPDQFADLVRTIRRVEMALGAGEKLVTAAELDNKSKMQKSIHYRTNLERGYILTEADLTCKRPATGVSPKLLGDLVGRRLRVDVRGNTRADLGDVDLVEQ